MKYRNCQLTTNAFAGKLPDLLATHADCRCRHQQTFQSGTLLDYSADDLSDC